MDDKVSIIIPVYNGENYLEECLDSLVKQPGNFEIILVNDGSIDNSYQICLRYTRNYSNVIAIDQKNMGPGGARNTGIQRSSGRYIMFVDCDDTVEDNIVAELLDVIDDADLAVCGYVNYAGNNREEKKLQSGKYSLNKYLDFIKEKNIDPICFGPICKLYKSKIIKQNGIEFENRENYAEDLIFNLKYLKFCREISVTDEILYKRIERSSSLSSGGKDAEYIVNRNLKIDDCFRNTFESCTRFTNIYYDFTFYIFVCALAYAAEGKEEPIRKLKYCYEVMGPTRVKDFKNKCTIPLYRTVNKILYFLYRTNNYHVMRLFILLYRAAKS